MPFAHVAGDLLAPHLDLEFAPNDVHPVSAVPLRGWVRDTLGATFVDGRWRLSRLDEQSIQHLVGAGFVLLDDRGFPSDFALIDLTTPILTRHDDDRFVRAWVRMSDHPAFFGERYAIVDPHLTDIDDLARRSIDWLDGWRPRSRPAPTPQPVVEEVPVEPVTFDGTLEGLRAISVSVLSNVTADDAVALTSMGIESIYDVLHTAPRRYIDRSNPIPVTEDAIGSNIAFVGEVTKKTIPNGPKGVASVYVRDVSTGKSVQCRWFNMTWATRRFNVGMRVVVCGDLVEWRSAGGVGYLQMQNPIVEDLGDAESLDPDARMIGIYPASKKVSTWKMRAVAREAAARFTDVLDPWPQFGGGVSRSLALRHLHLPPDPAAATAARDRLARDEILRWQLSLLVSRFDDRIPPVVHVPTGELTDAFIAKLPFTLTDDQASVIADVRADMSAPKPMRRLLQGEVGSGKTIVALYAALLSAESGHTAAIMAPTGSLAVQHYEELRHLMPEANIALLTNKVTGKARQAVLAGLADGSVRIAVGTQALLSESVKFASLGLVIIDESHRFGVEQRGLLTTRAAAAGARPDELHMTATPTPRTATLTMFADLDVSYIRKPPSGRSPIVTKIEPDVSASSPIWEHMRTAIDTGRQAFVVTPLVSESETRQTAGAEATAEYVRTVLPDARVVLAHGKLSPKELAEAMERFAAGEYDVMVATTVIEVGINVPNASIIAITGADGFGIAQLHQIRGRVGRGEHPGTCYLVPGPAKEGVDVLDNPRLAAVASSTDGFVLAELDLQLRGPGALSGVKQSGKAADLRIANISDTEMIASARADAFTLSCTDPGLKRHPLIRSEIVAVLGSDSIAALAIQ